MQQSNGQVMSVTWWSLVGFWFGDWTAIRVGRRFRITTEHQKVRMQLHGCNFGRWLEYAVQYVCCGWIWPGVPYSVLCLCQIARGNWRNALQILWEADESSSACQTRLRWSTKRSSEGGYRWRSGTARETHTWKTECFIWRRSSTRPARQLRSRRRRRWLQLELICGLVELCWISASQSRI